eukprot:CAMPEP_0197659242 /NCGR_PEP_ID=MMETSP1338-20131121/46812_1 /TAXON_ID=43686 ORGANISM="Pelagodinium beii, Strain RCC1491" /NCGR_SAMPLE_ID=MMETSP1338 /ASSEMBLY_ACC=CAM_ASM_000754 /LENGTH=197 /DNA_ID=CAMNT_0043236071 /DNA_START=32 /DNA_END=625 /DNA_ORIENTATION=-
MEAAWQIISPPKYELWGCAVEVENISKVLQDVAKHYGMASAATVLANDSLPVMVSTAPLQVNIETAANSKLFKLLLKRRVPTIIQDTKTVEHVKNDPLISGIRFYAEAPIIARNGDFLGSVTLFDDQPQYVFNLADCEVLKGGAAQISKLITSSPDHCLATRTATTDSMAPTDAPSPASKTPTEDEDGMNSILRQFR